MSNSFGKPEWFRKRKAGFGVIPTTWQGFAYGVVALAVVTLPFIGFWMNSRVPEAFVWAAAAAGMIAWDVRGIQRAIQAKADADLFIIDENETGSELATRNFDMQLRE